MKRISVSLFAAVALIIFAASGSILLQPEHQAYVMFLGLENTPDNGVQLSALCPKIAGDSPAEYQLFTVQSDGIAGAFRELELSVPRHIVYVQLKSLILTPDFAAGEHMNDLVYYLLLGAEYYSDAWVMITETPPSEFLSEYRPAIGTRLSSSIQATMANASALNSIPDFRLADLLDGWNSGSGDVLSVACTVEQYGETKSIHPEGAWLFADYKPVLRLTAEETALLNWLRGTVRSIEIKDGTDVVHITPELPPKVVFNRDQNKIEVSGHFVQHLQGGSMLRSQVQYLLEDRIGNLIEKCRAAGSEPFRFSEYAAARCLTLQQYLQQNFPGFYQNAVIDVHVQVRNELT